MTEKIYDKKNLQFYRTLVSLRWHDNSLGIFSLFYFLSHSFFKIRGDTLDPERSEGSPSSYKFFAIDDNPSLRSGSDVSPRIF